MMYLSHSAPIDNLRASARGALGSQANLKAAHCQALPRSNYSQHLPSLICITFIWTSWSLVHILPQERAPVEAEAPQKSPKIALGLNRSTTPDIDSQAINSKWFFQIDPDHIDKLVEIRKFIYKQIVVFLTLIHFFSTFPIMAGEEGNGLTPAPWGCPVTN
jgi:hypothetical protein